MSSAGHADTVGEQDAIVINRLNASDFEVIEEVTFGAAEFWCGAASFVERRSGLSGQTPIYVKTPRGPSVTSPGRIGVVFTLDGSSVPGDVDMGFTVSASKPGMMMKAVRARSFCRDAFTRSTK
jgi:hypothetical protein